MRVWNREFFHERLFLLRSLWQGFFSRREKFFRNSRDWGERDFSKALFHTAVGVAVFTLVLWGIIFVLTGRSGSEQRTITARFSNVGELTIGSLVRMNGVEIGKVSLIRLNPDSPKVEVRMRIDGRYRLPANSQAVVTPASLLGGARIDLHPGDEKMELSKETGTIKNSQGALRLDILLRRILISGIIAELEKAKKIERPTK